MKKIITVFAIALVIISCKKSEEEIYDELAEIITLPPSQYGEDITLNGEIISFGIPTATEYGFLYADSIYNSPLKFNMDGITLAKGITNLPILYPTDKYIKYTTNTEYLEPGKYKFIAYIRNSKVPDYGEEKELIVKDSDGREPEIISASHIINDYTTTFIGKVPTMTDLGDVEKVGFVISRISSFIPSEATKYVAITRDTFKISFKTVGGTKNSIINNTKYYARAYVTYHNPDTTYYSYNKENIVVGKLPLEMSEGEIETLKEPHEEGSNTTLNGRIISFGKPASTEHGFLLTNEEFTKYSLVFNTNNKTTDKKIRIIPIPADIAGNIEYSSALVHGNYWYRAWIRNSLGVEYGDVEKFTK